MSSLNDMIQNWSATMNEEDGALESAVVASLEDERWIDCIFNDDMDPLTDPPQATASVDIKSENRSLSPQDEINALFGDSDGQGSLQSVSGGFQGTNDKNLNNINLPTITLEDYALRGASSWGGVSLSGRGEDDLDPILVGPSLFRSNTVPTSMFGFGDGINGCEEKADQNDTTGSLPLSSCGRSSDSNSTVAREASGTKCRRGKGGSNGMSTEQLKNLDPKKVKRIMSNRASAARSKERKVQYIRSLEAKMAAYRQQSKELRAQFDQLQRMTMILGRDNGNTSHQLSIIKRSIQKYMVMNETLRLRLSGGHVNNINPHNHQAHIDPRGSRTEQNPPLMQSFNVISSENPWQPTFMSGGLRSSHVHSLVRASSGVVQEPVANQQMDQFLQHTTGCDLGNYQMGANGPSWGDLACSQNAPTSNGVHSAMHVDVSADNWTHGGADAP